MMNTINPLILGDLEPLVSANQQTFPSSLRVDINVIERTTPTPETKAAALFERSKSLELNMDSLLMMRQLGLTITKNQMDQSILHGNHEIFYLSKDLQQQVNSKQLCLTLGSTCFLPLCLPGLPSVTRLVTPLLHSLSISLQLSLFQTRPNMPSLGLPSALVRTGADWSI